MSDTYAPPPTDRPVLPPATLGKAVLLGVEASRSAPAAAAAAVSAAATAAAVIVLLEQAEDPVESR